MGRCNVQTDLEPRWPGAQGNPADEGSYDHRPQAAQRHSHRQSRGQRRPRGHRLGRPGPFPRRFGQHEWHADQRRARQAAPAEGQRPDRARPVQAHFRRRERAARTRVRGLRKDDGVASGGRQADIGKGARVGGAACRSGGADSPAHTLSTTSAGRSCASARGRASRGHPSAGRDPVSRGGERRHGASSSSSP